MLTGYVKLIKTNYVKQIKKKHFDVWNLAVMWKCIPATLNNNKNPAHIFLNNKLLTKSLF